MSAYIKLKIFCAAQEIAEWKKTKKLTKWLKIHLSHISDKGSISKIHKELQLNVKIETLITQVKHGQVT
jgi:tRNA1(Val) A37 N6-methylase TrmN6